MIVEVDRETFDRHWAMIQDNEAKRAEKLPDEQACLGAAFEAWKRLSELGWREIIYCPKDGTVFDSVSMGSTGIHDCHYHGEWPEGGWWVHDGGDLWPARPFMFRLKPEIR